MRLKERFNDFSDMSPSQLIILIRFDYRLSVSNLLNPFTYIYYMEFWERSKCRNYLNYSIPFK